MTNIELQHLAITYATNFGKSEDISVIIKSLSLVERNFKLLKGESTVELEKTKLDVSTVKDTLKTVIDALPKLR